VTINKVDLEDFKDEVRKEILAIHVKIENHMKCEEAFRPHVKKLIKLMEDSSTIFSFIKYVAWIVAPVMAVIYWIKDHVKL
jgi:hypothetical protein